MVEGLCDPHERSVVTVVGKTGWFLGFDPDFTCDITCPQAPWHPHSFPLQPSRGIVQLRFEVRTDGLFDSSPGWFVDDVAVVDSPAPATYCTGKVTSASCTPDVACGGALPSASDPTACTISCSGLIAGKSGMFLYGLTGQAATPFLGGTLCVAPPIKRTFVQGSGGTHTCSGYLSLDFNARIQGGTDPLLVPGQPVDRQWWFRDPNGSFDAGLSDAIDFVVQV